MCGRFELKTKFEKLPTVLKQDYPTGLDSKYETQNLIRPNDPVLVIKNEGRMKTTFMKWGFISPWAKDPFDKERPRPFNARSETVEEKKLFSGSWKHKRCLIPASGFFPNSPTIFPVSTNIYSKTPSILLAFLMNLLTSVLFELINQ